MAAKVERSTADTIIKMFSASMPSHYAACFYCVKVRESKGAKTEQKHNKTISAAEMFAENSKNP